MALILGIGVAVNLIVPLQPDGQKYTVFPLEVAKKQFLYPMPAPRRAAR